MQVEPKHLLMKKSAAGFSLIELLIVVVIIGIIAAIAVSGFLASKRSANEGSMIATSRILHGAQMSYASTYGFGEYAGDTGGGTNAGLNIMLGLGLIDEVVGSGNKSGYHYVGGREARSGVAPAQFFFSAIPISSDTMTGTGNRRFGVATDGVLRADTTLSVHYANVGEVLAAGAIGN